jgi:hypothetical protein
MKQYEPAFEVGDEVRIAGRATLESFRRKWKHHNPLQPEQLDYADRVVTIRNIGIYHGGDVIYQLVEAPGVWHEDCLLRGKRLPQR